MYYTIIIDNNSSKTIIPAPSPITKPFLFISNGLFAVLIGRAFQIQDDIIDIESPSSISGKDQGSDEEQDKITYPSLAGLKESKLRAQDLAKEGKEILQLISKNTDNLSSLADYIVSRKT